MSKEYIIEIENHSGVKFYISGGTYKFGHEKYARTTLRPCEAKRYGRKGSAISAGNRLAKSCVNIKFIQVIEVN